jgi:hypothetical protein
VAVRGHHVNVVLVNDEGGAKVAICQEEVEYDLSLGWRIYEPEDEEPIGNAFAPKKRGRPRKVDA